MTTLALSVVGVAVFLYALYLTVRAAVRDGMIQARRSVDRPGDQSGESAAGPQRD